MRPRPPALESRSVETTFKKRVSPGLIEQAYQLFQFLAGLGVAPMLKGIPKVNDAYIAIGTAREVRHRRRKTKARSVHFARVPHDGVPACVHHQGE